MRFPEQMGTPLFQDAGHAFRIRSPKKYSPAFGVGREPPDREVREVLALHTMNPEFREADRFFQFREEPAMHEAARGEIQGLRMEGSEQGVRRAALEEEDYGAAGLQVSAAPAVQAFRQVLRKVVGRALREEDRGAGAQIHEEAEGKALQTREARQRHGGRKALPLQETRCLPGADPLAAGAPKPARELCGGPVFPPVLLGGHIQRPLREIGRSVAGNLSFRGGLQIQRHSEEAPHAGSSVSDERQRIARADLQVHPLKARLRAARERTAHRFKGEQSTHA